MVDSLVKYGNITEDSRQLYVQDTLPLLAAVRLARLKDPENPKLERAELTAQLTACKSLFAEGGVGVTTVGDEEIKLAESLNAAVVDRMKSSGLFDYRAGYEQYDPKDLYGVVGARTITDTISREGHGSRVDNLKRLFWEDTRHAGQLEYHNTTNFRGVWRQAGLMTRRMQEAQTGSIHTSTSEYRPGGGEQHIHSPTVHFSEQFDPRSYRAKPGSPDAGTLAIPLAEIIKTTPYARNAQYGILQLKPDSRALSRIPLNEKLGDIGAGMADMQGSGGIDRTFYRSPHDTDPDAPLDQAPDGYTYNFRDMPMTWIQLGDQEVQNQWEHGFGRGEHLPTSFAIDVDTNNLLAEESKITARIQALQQASLQKYQGQVVVPLRSGVMDFYVPDDGVYAGRHSAQFTKVTEPTATQLAA
jgi:hypothetical protein